MRGARGLVVLTVAAALGGCAVGYYAQAVRGHFALMAEREPIAPLLADESVEADVRDKLATVLEAREFASRELGLPDNDSYRSYADLGRPYVVWNVVAAPELSLAPKQWCFPFVGCLAYKGWFDESRARREAQRLREAGYDVTVGGVAAYSTLGRFDDPFLNTMLGYSDARTAGLIFHELAHQAVYVKGETEFNEGFATFVAEQGVRRWLEARGEPRAFAQWAESLERQREFTALVLDARERLGAVYADAALTDAQKRARKQQELDGLRARYARLRDGRWGGYAGYDGWFDESLNNAKLASVATYRRLLPAFGALLAQADGDFAAFLGEVEALAGAPAAEREQRLAALMAVSGDGQTVRR